jgi:hypothetical protein
MVVRCESNLITDFRMYDSMNLGIRDPGDEGCVNSYI